MFFSRVTLPLLPLVVGLMQCNAFAPISPLSTATSSKSPLQVPNHSSVSSSPTKLNLVPESMSSDGARGLFFLWFFGASGGGGIAVSAFPQMIQNFKDVQGLKDVGPTLGGPKIGLSPLCGYPQDLCLADVEKILKNKMSTEDMVKKGPKDSFWAEKGYLRYEAFEQANKKCNPLAIRVVFDALTTSVSTVSPVIAQEALDSFRGEGGIEVFKRTLLLEKSKGYSAIAFLLFLLGIAATTCATSLAIGWFPDWPGNDNFPIGLVSPGFWTIPDYWI